MAVDKNKNSASKSKPKKIPFSGPKKKAANGMTKGQEIDQVNMTDNPKVSKNPKSNNKSNKLQHKKMEAGKELDTFEHTDKLHNINQDSQAEAVIPLQPELKFKDESESTSQASGNNLFWENKYFSLFVSAFVGLILLFVLWFSFSTSSVTQFEVQAQVSKPVQLNNAELYFVTSSNGVNLPDLIELETLKSKEIENYFLNQGVSSSDIYQNQSYFSTSSQASLAGLSEQNNLQSFYRIILRDVDQDFVQEILSGLYPIGLDRIDAVRYTDERLKETCDEIRQEAMNQAEDQAETILSQRQSGRVLEKAFEIQLDCVGDDFSYFPFAEGQDSRPSGVYGLTDSSISFSSQNQTLKTQVRLTIKYQS